MLDTQSVAMVTSLYWHDGTKPGNLAVLTRLLHTVTADRSSPELISRWNLDVIVSQDHYLPPTAL